MTFRSLLAVVAALCGAASAPTASAQTAVFFDTRAAFLAALGSATPATQDFSGYAVGANLAGAAVVPGLIAGSSFGSLEVFNSALPNLGRVMFGLDSTTRLAGTGHYDLTNLGGYTAIGFDIAAWAPATSGANVVLTFNAGAPITHNLTATNSLESEPVFFGVITSVALTSLRLNEPFEIGSLTNEEIAIDNIAAALAPVPEPTTLALLALGLTVVTGAAARRRRDGLRDGSQPSMASAQADEAT